MFVNNEQFLATIFGSTFNMAHVAVFHEDPNTLGDHGRMVWAGGHWGNLKGNFTQAGNQYFTISTFLASSDGKARRQKALFERCNVVVIDDVGHGLSAKVDPNDPRLLEPSYKLETSPGNEQWGYILYEPETNRHKIENLLSGMVSANLCPDGKDPGMKGVTRYVRLPEGTNNKEKYIDVLGAPFTCRLNYWMPVNQYHIEQLAEAFGIDLYASTGVEDRALVTDSDHPSFLAFQQHYHIKAPLGDGRFDVTCPNVHMHTDAVDNGTAIFIKDDGRLGIKCHHGNCDDYSGKNLMADLLSKDPTLLNRIADYDRKHMFHALEGAPPVTIDNSSQQLINAQHIPQDLPPVDPNQPAPVASIEDMIRRFSDNTTTEEIERVLPYLVDLTPLKSTEHLAAIVRMTGRSKISINHAFKWLKEQLQRSQAFTRDRDTLDFMHAHESGVPKATMENLQILLDHRAISVRYNIMDRNIEFDIPGEEFESDSLRNSQYLRMDSLMEQYGLNSVKTGKYLDIMAQQNQYHPFREYLDKAGAWDGVDRIQILADTLEVEEHDKMLRDVLLLRWLISVPAAAFRPIDDTSYGADTFFKLPPPRGILTLVGPQYMGKTRWLRTITPNGMFKDGLQLQTDKDGIKQATNKLIVEIGESDATIGGRHAGELKAFIGKDMDEVRLPWAKTEVKWPRRTVFAGTVNPSQFLQDTTGNTRWWVLKIKKINFFLLSLIDMKQMWLQVESLYNQGLPWLLSKDEMKMLNQSNEQYSTVSDLEDWFRDKFDFSNSKSIDSRENWMTSTKVRELLEINGFKNPRNLRGTLKKLTGRDNGLVAGNHTTQRLWRLPALRKGVENDSGFKPL